MSVSAAQINPHVPTAAAALASPRRAKPNPFGAAKPREHNLKAAGVDLKALDEKIEAKLEQLPSSMTPEEKETYKELADALTQLKLDLDAATDAGDAAAQTAARQALTEKQAEKREFVKNVRRTKLAQPYRPPIPGAQRGGGHPQPAAPPTDNSLNPKLYVGDLDPSVTAEVLMRAFAMFGMVQDAEVCKNRDTGFSRGYGFVTMGLPEQASVALATLSHNGGIVPFQPTPVRVNYANTRRRQRYVRGGGYSNQRQEAFQSFGNTRYRQQGQGGGFNGNFQQQQQQQRGGYGHQRGGYSRGGYQGRGYQGGRGRGRGYGGQGQGGYQDNRGYRGGGYNQHQRGGQYGGGYHSAPRPAGNWQQQKATGYAHSQPQYLDDQGDHAMMDRMLEGDMY